MKALSSEDQIVALSAAKFLPQVILLADGKTSSLDIARREPSIHSFSMTRLHAIVEISVWKLNQL